MGLVWAQSSATYGNDLDFCQICIKSIPPNKRRGSGEVDMGRIWEKLHHINSIYNPYITHSFTHTKPIVGPYMANTILFGEGKSTQLLKYQEANWEMHLIYFTGKRRTGKPSKLGKGEREELFHTSYQPAAKSVFLF